MNKTKRITGILGLPYVFWAAAFIIIPLIMVVWYGLTDANGAFTLANVAAIAEPAHRKALLMALLLSFIATIVCLVLAYPLCMFLVETNKNSTSFLTMLLIVPMWMNFLLRTYAWQSLLEKTGIINTFLTSIGLQPLRMINTKDDRVGLAPHGLGQLAALVVSDISRRGSDEAADGVALLVLAHVDAGDHGFVIEQEFMVAYDWNLGSGLSLVLLIFIIINVIVSMFTERE